MNPKYRLIFFDVDSTLVTIEGIDVLAGGNPEIVRLTEAAMNGEVPLDEVYGRRLEIIRPTRVMIDTLVERYLSSLVPGAEETIAALREAGCIIHLVTAGIEQALTPLAAKLGVALHAVRLRFSDDGAYVDFDRASPLTRSGGKEVVVRDIRARSKGKAAFIGDGASDLQAKPAVDLFIGFGGVHTRPRVRENADAFVSSLSELPAMLS
ncbi:MAG TPA: HAD-IB family phosphatase [Thermoanaerobaculia bacterium]|nr:HAD-IB family phosphatase [Thermoanaerobaculia bacterium]